MRSSIYFFKEDIQFRFLKKIQISKWIKSVIRKEGRKCGEINIIFCSDRYLLDLNKKFLSHNYFTDVITFYTSSGNEVSGEIYVSVDRVKDNASAIGVPFVHELSRVIIHGVLHLLGYSDSSKALKTAMRLKEDACLSLLPSFT